MAFEVTPPFLPANETNNSQGSPAVIRNWQLPQLFHTLVLWLSKQQERTSHNEKGLHNDCVAVFALLLLYVVVVMRILVIKPDIMVSYFPITYGMELGSVRSSVVRMNRRTIVSDFLMRSSMPPSLHCGTKEKRQFVYNKEK